MQPLFERLYRISLRGMNYGLGGMIESSGEINLVKLITNQLINSEGKKVIFDIGANNGKYTDILLKQFSFEKDIYCFEPSRFTFKQLNSKLGNINEVHLQNLGLGANKERRKLYFDTEGSGWASVFERMDTGFNQKLDKSEEITLTSLDDFCYENDIRQIDFLKADVEGFELEVFHGSKNMLPYIYFIQFEFSFANYNSKTYLKDFFELLADFDIYRVINDGISKIDYDPRYEILLTSNYLAVNKKLNIEF